MELLIIFESLEGQTSKIAKFVEKRIIDAGHGVRRFNSEDELAPLSFDGIDAVVLAAPVHERRHPKNFEVLISASRAELKARKTLLISVSLKAAFPDGREDAQDYLTELEMRTSFTPTQEVMVAGAVRASSYGYFESQVIKNVVLAGHDVDLVDGVREFTDWHALGDEIDRFLNEASVQVD